MTSIAQIKAGRALLDWSQDDLAREARLSKNAINNLERGIANPRVTTLSAIDAALTRGGVEFLDGPGVRLRGELLKVEMIAGADALARLFSDIVATLKGRRGAELLACGIGDALKPRAQAGYFTQFLKQCQRHRIKSRVLVREGEAFFIASLGHQRGIPASVHDLLPYFVYADRHAVLLDEKRIIVTENARLADAYSRQFMRLWESAATAKSGGWFGHQSGGLGAA